MFFMIQSRRRRRYYLQALPEDRRCARFPVKLLVGILLFVIIGWGVGQLFKKITPGARGQRIATILQTEGRGRVQVTISGEGTPQRAETGLRLYDGDRIFTDGSAYAILRFFDGSVVTLDDAGNLVLGDVLRGEEQSVISLKLDEGRLWVSAGTGSTVARSIATGRSEVSIPAHTKAIIGTDPVQDDLYVFDSSGPGVRMKVDGGEIIVGEGQELHLSSEQISSIKQGTMDPYWARSALDQAILSSGFYVSNVQRKEEEIIEVAEIEEPGETTVDGELLVIDQPSDGAQLQGSAVIIKGRVGSKVAQVSVNGYNATLQGGTFEKELALPAEEEFTVDVLAEDKDGLLMVEKSLALSHDIKPPDPPTIIEPAQAGSEVAISLDSFEIIGEAPPDVAGVIVNGYQLQKFQQGKPWRYLVDPAIGNVRIGENTYEAVVVDRAGNRSEPASITILWKAQPLPTPDDLERTRDTQAYRAQGSLSVIAPTSGETFITSADEVLIEGLTHPDTHSVSVNGFNLRLFLPGKTTWNYIAKSAFNNYHQGINRYTVVARDGEGQILDVLQYSIEKK